MQSTDRSKVAEPSQGIQPQWRIGNAIAILLEATTFFVAAVQHFC
jgi:hypothetical protein